METEHMFTLKNTTRSGENGFTLIELMIVITIIAILAAVGIPAYQEYVIKAARSDGQGALMGFANAMERHFTTNGTYLGAGAGGGDDGAPTIFSTKSPIDGGSTKYNLTIKNDITASTYTLVADAVGGQADNGDMELTSTGVRRWDRDNDGFGGGDNTWSNTYE